MLRDQTFHLAPISAIAPQRPTGTNDVTGSSVDVRGFDSATLLIHTGAQGDTLTGSLKIDFVLQDSNDNTGWTNVTTGDIVGATSITNGIVYTIDSTVTASGSLAEIGYVGGQRYVRLTADLTGTHTNGTFIASQVVRGRGHQRP